MRAATVVHASLAGLVLSFTACFILLVIAPLVTVNRVSIHPCRNRDGPAYVFQIITKIDSE